MGLPSIDSVERELEFLPLLDDSLDDLCADDLEFQHEDGWAFLSVPFAESVDGRWQTMIDVGFREHTNSRPDPTLSTCDFCEFSYEISLVDLYGEFPITSTMDRFKAAGWLPKDSGDLVLEVVSYCYCYIIIHFEPSLIYRVTNLSGLPKAAMARYEFLTQIIEKEGYWVFLQSKDTEGRSFWFMVRNGFDVSDLVAKDSLE